VSCSPPDLPASEPDQGRMAGLVQDVINAVYSEDETPFNHCFMADSKTFAASNPKDDKTLIAGMWQVLSWGGARVAPGTCRNRSSS
jgi:hypothetical protein